MTKPAAETDHGAGEGRMLSWSPSGRLGELPILNWSRCFLWSIGALYVGYSCSYTRFEKRYPSRPLLENLESDFSMD